MPGAMTARRTLSVTGTANRDQLHPTLTYKDTSNYEKMEEPLFESPKCRIFGIISGHPQYPEWKNSKSVLELLPALTIQELFRYLRLAHHEISGAKPKNGFRIS